MNTADKLPTMKTRGKAIAATGISLGVVALVVAGVYALGASMPAASPTPTPSVTEEAAPVPFIPPMGADTDERQAHAVAEAARIEAERVAAEAAAAEAARVAAEQAAAEEAARAAEKERQQSDMSDPEPPAAPVVPAGPIKCPPGSQANSGDGGNDTSCLPEICFHISLPDPAHPECQTPFRP